MRSLAGEFRQTSDKPNCSKASALETPISTSFIQNSPGFGKQMRFYEKYTKKEAIEKRYFVKIAEEGSLQRALRKGEIMREFLQ